MREVLITDRASGKPLWVNLVDPAPAEMAALREEYGLHYTLVNDCLEIGHLPKHERIGALTFLIVRAFDDTSLPQDDNLNRITQKVAIFLGDRFLLTVHRRDPSFLRAIKARWTGIEDVYLQTVLLEILLAAVETYQGLLLPAERDVERFEAAVLNEASGISGWAELFRLKSRLAITKRMLWHSLHVLQRFHPRSSENIPLVQDVRERVESLGFFTDGLIEDLHNLQSIQLSLNANRLGESSNRTNEVVRLLTVFSIFFLPMNFIVGLYGMNFVHMPELRWRYGYAYVPVLIVATVLGIYVWFRRRGWLQ